jgi:predicted aconitase
MDLTSEEERMLKSDDWVTRRCLEHLVKYGEAAGAERLVDIDGNVVIPTFSSTIPELGIDVSDPEIAGRRLKAFTISRNWGVSQGWEDVGVAPWNEPEDHKRREETMRSWMRVGVHPINSCAYYLTQTYLPTVGQYCSWHESSAIPYGNALLGARINFDLGAEFAVAYTAKAPAYDMRVDENRVATKLVRCETRLSSDMDYDLFGWAVGEALALDVPVMTGIGRPNQTQILKMNTELNTGGQVRMYHVPGLTPEAPSVEAALKGSKPVETVDIRRRDLKRAYEKMNYASDEDVDFVYLGCPFYSINDLRLAAYYLEGKRCRAKLWIVTDDWTFRVGEAMGYRQIIKKAGAVLLAGACAVVSTGVPPDTDVMAVDACKQDYYITGGYYPKKLQVWYGTMEDCIDAAVTGKWRGKWPGGE